MSGVLLSGGFIAFVSLLFCLVLLILHSPPLGEPKIPSHNTSLSRLPVCLLQCSFSWCSYVNCTTTLLIVNVQKYNLASVHCGYLKKSISSGVSSLKTCFKCFHDSIKCFKCFHDSIKCFKCFHDSIKCFKCFHDSIKCFKCFHDSIKCFKCFHDSIKCFKCFHDSIKCISSGRIFYRVRYIFHGGPYPMSHRIWTSQRKWTWAGLAGGLGEGWLAGGLFYIKVSANSINSIWLSCL